MSRLIRAQLRWAGHVVRVDDSRIPSALLYGQPTQGKCAQGRKRYKDNPKVSLNSCNINWEEVVADRAKWKQRPLRPTKQLRSLRKGTDQHRRTVIPAVSAIEPVPPRSVFTPTNDDQFLPLPCLPTHLSYRQETPSLRQ